MILSELFQITRSKFPTLSKLADVEHVEIWGEIEIESEFSWFGSLANTVNYEMTKDEAAESIKELFEFISHYLTKGDEEVINCIDVSFAENLFGEVPAEKAEKYWAFLPANLKKLYLDFHARKPF